MMKQLLTIIFLSIYSIATAQVGEHAELFEVLKLKDSLLFELGFNQCDLVYLESSISDELTFYHDQSGVQDKVAFLENTKKYICSDSPQKPIRQLENTSLEVFPLYDNGVIYGAIQKGIHYFYLREDGKEDVLTSVAKFTHVWTLQNENWILSEVLSYDHQNP